MFRFASILTVIVVGLASGCNRAGPKGGGNAGGGADGGRPGTMGGTAGDTGETAGHLTGTWEGMGEGRTYLLYTFEADGGFVMLESPGTGTGKPKDDPVRGTYTLRNNSLTVQVAGQTRQYTVKVADRLMLVLVSSQGQDLIFHRSG